MKNGKKPRTIVYVSSAMQVWARAHNFGATLDAIENLRAAYSKENPPRSKDSYSAYTQVKLAGLILRQEERLQRMKEAVR